MDDELRGWKAIADYFGTSDRTVQRWERDLALPVRRRGNAKGSAVVASRLELDEWRSSPAGRQAEGEQVHDPAPPPARVRRPLAWVLAAIALLLVTAASWYLGPDRLATRGPSRGPTLRLPASQSKLTARRRGCGGGAETDRRERRGLVRPRD